MDHIPEQSEAHARVDYETVRYRSIKALVYTVFEEYTRTVPQIPESKPKSSVLIETFTYLSEHFTENVDLTDVAAALGYSPTYISHAISAMPNMNFRRLLNSLRIDRAKLLLVSNDFRLIDIALECGFTSERTFYRAFSEIVGITPTEYRRLKQKPLS